MDVKPNDRSCKIVACFRSMASSLTSTSSFVGLAYQGKARQGKARIYIVFRFIIEYNSSLRDFGSPPPLGNNK
jgi:hypothetical protein